MRHANRELVFLEDLYVVIRCMLHTTVGMVDTPCRRTPLGDGGRTRVAELIVFKEPSTGAANDLERATDLARRMVTEFGMSESLGPVRYINNAGMGYLGTAPGLRQEISPETATLIDREVKNLVEGAQKWATELLTEHLDALKQVAQTLQEKEVISGEEIARIAGNNKT